MFEIIHIAYATEELSADQKLYQATIDGKVEEVGIYWMCGANIEQTDELGHTPLMKALGKPGENYDKLIQLLLRLGANPNHTDAMGYTSLMVAACGANPERIGWLLDKGADINKQDDMKQWSALMWAAFRGIAENFKVLLGRGANAELMDNENRTAFDLTRNPAIEAMKK